MKETKFIEKNKEKWKRFERLSEKKVKDPDELSNQYTDILFDLSYAKTFYEKRTVKSYLNQLAQRVHTGFHIQKGESLKKLIHVWKTSLPLEIYRSRKNLFLALVIFLICATIGAISTHFHPEFADLILGRGYVDMTLENIKLGKPLHVYSLENRVNYSHVQMFIDITWNNLRVAFLCYIFGVFLGIGTYIILFNNAIMVGTFQYFFIGKNLLLVSFLGIWIHGAFEISAIILSAGAGITLGNGLLFPGSYTRMQSLQLAAKRSIKIMLSLVPFIIIAGYLESYVTANYQELSALSKWTLILFCFGIILFYFVIYPIIVARKNPHLLNEEEPLIAPSSYDFKLTRLRSFGELISHSFAYYNKNFTRIMKPIFNIWFPIALVLAYFQDKNHVNDMIRPHLYDWSKQLEIMMGFAYENLTDFAYNFAWLIVLTGLISSITFSFQVQTFSFKAYFKYYFKRFFILILGAAFCYYLFFVPNWGWYFLLLFLYPFFSLPFIGAALGEDSLKSWAKSWKYSLNEYGTILLLIILYAVIFALFIQPIAFIGSQHGDTFITEPPVPDLLDLATDFIKQISIQLEWDPWYVSNSFRQVIYLLFLFLILPIWILMLCFTYFNAKEKDEVNELKEELKYFGKRQRTKEWYIDED